jgi:hypothetical protein
MPHRQSRKQAPYRLRTPQIGVVLLCDPSVEARGMGLVSITLVPGTKIWLVGAEPTVPVAAGTWERRGLRLPLLPLAPRAIL